MELKKKKSVESKSKNESENSGGNHRGSNHPEVWGRLIILFSVHNNIIRNTNIYAPYVAKQINNT